MPYALNVFTGLFDYYQSGVAVVDGVYLTESGDYLITESGDYLATE